MRTTVCGKFRPFRPPFRACDEISDALRCRPPDLLARPESDDHTGWYASGEQRSQQGAGRRAGICFVAAPRRCHRIACVAAPCICPPGARAEVHHLFRRRPLVEDREHFPDAKDHSQKDRNHGRKEKDRGPRNKDHCQSDKNRGHNNKDHNRNDKHHRQDGKHLGRNDEHDGGTTKTVVETANTMVIETNTTVGTINSMVVATNTMVLEAKTMVKMDPCCKC